MRIFCYIDNKVVKCHLIYMYMMKIISSISLQCICPVDGQAADATVFGANPCGKFRACYPR